MLDKILRILGLLREVTCMSCGSRVKVGLAKRSPLGWLCTRCSVEERKNRGRIA